MTNRPPIPWLLGIMCVAVTVATWSYGVPPHGPPAATAAQLEWRVLLSGPPTPRGPFRHGLFLSDVASDGNVTFGVGGAGNASVTFRSTDDGVSWNEVDLVSGGTYIAFGDNGLILVATRTSDLYRSTDAGKSWTSIKTEATRGMSGLALAGNVALVSGPDVLLRSRDRGASWQRVNVPKANLHDVGIRGAVVLAVGAGGLVLRSGDTGETFEMQWREESIEGLASVAFANDTTAVVVGASGTILRSTDAGRSWLSVASPMRVLWRSVAFSDERHGLAVGDWGQAIRTTDGGATWMRELTGTNAHLYSVNAHPSAGYLVCGVRETILRATER